MRACDSEWSERLSAFFDGETEAEETALVQAHLPTCRACEDMLRALRGIGVGLRANEPGPGASVERVRERVLGVVRTRTRRKWLHRVAVAAVVVVVAGGAGLWRSEKEPLLERALVTDLEAQHLKAFAHGRLCEFESSDPAAVGEWLESNAATHVSVPTFDDATLVGARRCKISGEPAVALVYRVGDEGMTVFLPSTTSKAALAAASFSSGETRCTDGLLGERICARSQGGRSALAVGVSDPALVLASMAVLGPG